MHCSSYVKIRGCCKDCFFPSEVTSVFQVRAILQAFARKLVDRFYKTKLYE